MKNLLLNSNQDFRKHQIIFEKNFYHLIYYQLPQYIDEKTAILMYLELESLVLKYTCFI